MFLCSFEEGEGTRDDRIVGRHNGSEGGPSGTENTPRYVPLPFYTLKVKEGWQKMGRTDDDNGEVVVQGQPAVTGDTWDSARTHLHRRTVPLGPLTPMIPDSK
jgi:hypothetical protein